MADDGDGGQATTTYTQEQVQQLVEKEVAGLKAKRDELLGKVKALSDQVKPYEGLDPEKARKAMTALEQAEAEKAKALGDWDAREKQLREQFAAEHSKVVEPLSAKAKQLEADLFEAVAVRDALAAMPQKHIKGNPDLLLPIIRPELGVEVIDGKRTTVVKGPDGKARYNPTTGELITVEDRLLELRAIPRYAGAFEGTGASGAGAEAGSGNGSTAGAITLTPDQASDKATYDAALAKVGGDHSKITIAVK